MKRRLQVNDSIASPLFDFIEATRGKFPVADGDNPPNRPRGEDSSETASPEESAAVVAVQQPLNKKIPEQEDEDRRCRW